MFIHVIRSFYYTLGNLDPILRSSLKNIHLLCVAKYEMIKKYGIEEVLKPIVKSILELEKVFVAIMTSFSCYMYNVDCYAGTGRCI